MKKLIIILLLIVTNGLYAQLQPEKNTLTVDGKEVWVYTPSNYDATKTYPVVFELHGMRQTKDNMDDQGVVNEQQYIAVYPEGEELPIISGRAWNSWSETDVPTGSTNHVTFLTNVYNAVKGKIGTSSFDAAKVFVYGYSNGGAMAMKMLEETNLFKGAAIRSMTLKNGHTIPATASKVPMLFIHGVTDTTVPYQGGRGSYGSLAPNFMSVKTAVSAWATHNGASTTPMDIHYQDPSNTARPDFWFREYINTSVNAPVYLFAITNGGHGTEGFTNRNIKRSAIRLFKKPQCYGLARNSAACSN